MEDLEVVSDTRFYSMEDRMDQYQHFSIWVSSKKDWLLWISHGAENDSLVDDGLLVLYFSTSTSLALIRWKPPLFIFYVAKGENILRPKRLAIGGSYMHIIFVGSHIAYL